jgi:hypothetical protein
VHGRTRSRSDTAGRSSTIESSVHAIALLVADRSAADGVTTRLPRTRKPGNERQKTGRNGINGSAVAKVPAD